MRRVSLGLVLLCLGESATASPFLTRDQNPLLGGFALPMPLPATPTAPGTSRLDLIGNWSSTASTGLNNDEALLVDLESHELRLVLEHGFAPRYSLRLQVPYRSLGKGVLDGFIDGWHQALGLPDGARRFLERDQYQVGYLRSGRTLLNLYEPAQGFGDIAIEMGYQTWKNPSSAASLWLTLEAPTGDEKTLLGNGEWDAGIQIAGHNSVGARSSLYWQAGATYLGKGGYLAAWQKQWAASVAATFEYMVVPRFNFKVQVDAHSAIYASNLDFLGEAVILTIGGDYRFASGLNFALGIGEDIAVGSSPDVNFYFAVGKTF